MNIKVLLLPVFLSLALSGCIVTSAVNLAATTVMALIPMLVLTGSVVAEIATASRQLWSFARDGGVPFAPPLARVSLLLLSP